MKIGQQDFIHGLNELKKDFSFFDVEKATKTVEDRLLIEPLLTKVEYYKLAWMSQVLNTPLATTETSSIKDLAYMIDCSRNAVVKVETIQAWIRQLAVLGYQTLMLYLEDVYEVNDEPYFGYLRGRYSKEELKAIVAYADIFGIEVVPCIQTLAHYNQLVRWYEHLNVFDIGDVLFVGSTRANLLLDHIFSTLRECFSTHRINVGMDEAYLLGRGKYLDEHGLVDRFKIMKTQLDVVDSLCQKYGFKPMMWSDMFFKLANDNYYGAKAPLPPSVTELVKDRFDLVYWDYYHVDIEHYRTMINIHQALQTNIYFAAGAWKWSGFTPDNRYSLRTMSASMQVAKEKKIPLYIVTGWADNGAEASLFSVLPSLVYASLLRDNNTQSSFQSNVIMKALTGGLDFDDFMKIDSGNRGFIHDEMDYTNTTNRSLLYNDPLLGVMDSLATFIRPSFYEEASIELTKNKYHQNRYGYIFSTQLALLKLLHHKADFGLRLRKAYQEKQTTKLIELKDECLVMVDLLDVFMVAFKKQWHLENKPHGFDVQDLRLGGLKQRLLSTQQKLIDYLNGSINRIEELDEPILDYMCRGKEYTFDTRNCEYRMHRIQSVNVND